MATNSYTAPLNPSTNDLAAVQQSVWEAEFTIQQIQIQYQSQYYAKRLEVEEELFRQGLLKKAQDFEKNGIPILWFNQEFSLLSRKIPATLTGLTSNYIELSYDLGKKDSPYPVVFRISKDYLTSTPEQQRKIEDYLKTVLEAVVSYEKIKEKTQAQCLAVYRENSTALFPTLHSVEGYGPDSIAYQNQIRAANNNLNDYNLAKLAAHQIVQEQKNEPKALVLELPPLKSLEKTPTAALTKRALQLLKLLSQAPAEISEVVSKLKIQSVGSQNLYQYLNLVGSEVPAPNPAQPDFINFDLYARLRAAPEDKTVNYNTLEKLYSHTVLGRHAPVPTIWFAEDAAQATQLYAQNNQLTGFLFSNVWVEALERIFDRPLSNYHEQHKQVMAKLAVCQRATAEPDFDTQLFKLLTNQPLLTQQYMDRMKRIASATASFINASARKKLVDNQVLQDMVDQLHRFLRPVIQRPADNVEFQEPLKEIFTTLNRSFTHKYAAHILKELEKNKVHSGLFTSAHKKFKILLSKVIKIWKKEKLSEVPPLEATKKVEPQVIINGINLTSLEARLNAYQVNTVNLQTQGSVEREHIQSSLKEVFTLSQTLVSTCLAHQTVEQDTRLLVESHLSDYWKHAYQVLEFIEKNKGVFQTQSPEHLAEVAQLQKNLIAQFDRQSTAFKERIKDLITHTLEAASGTMLKDLTAGALFLEDKIKTTRTSDTGAPTEQPQVLRAHK